MGVEMIGTYERSAAEKYDEFPTALGVNMLLRKAATASTPKMEVKKDGEKYYYYLHHAEVYDPGVRAGQGVRREYPRRSRCHLKSCPGGRQAHLHTDCQGLRPEVHQVNSRIF